MSISRARLRIQSVVQRTTQNEERFASRDFFEPAGAAGGDAGGRVLDAQRGEFQRVTQSGQAGVYNIGILSVTPDGRWYVYSYVRDLSDLYMVEGLK